MNRKIFNIKTGHERIENFSDSEIDFREKEQLEIEKRKEKANIEKLIKDKIRQIAIESLKSDGLLPLDFK